MIIRFALLITVFIVLKDGLSNNFARVEVSVVDCPDLREKPFSLAAQGRIYWYHIAFVVYSVVKKSH